MSLAKKVAVVTGGASGIGLATVEAMLAVGRDLVDAGIVVTNSLAIHYPAPWEPVYASSNSAINRFVQTVRLWVCKHGIRVGSVSPGPVITGCYLIGPSRS